MRLARRMLAAGLLGPDPTVAMRLDLMALSVALDGRPFCRVNARVDIEPNRLSYALDAVPFVGVSR